MRLLTYLNYGGNCKQAFRFYEEHLGGKITMMMTHDQQPNPSEVSPDWKNAFLHARISIGETELMGADVPPDRFQPMRSAYLSLTVRRDRFETPRFSEERLACSSGSSGEAADATKGSGGC